MRSKTSCFNSTLFKIDLKGQFVAVLILLLMYFMVFILPGITNPLDKDMVASRALLILTNPVLIGVFSVCFVLFSFGYIYRKRSSYMMHAFPTTRTEAFLSHSLAGLISILIMAFVGYICLILINRGPLSYSQIWIGVLETFIEILFFYSMALFVAFVCGNGVLFVVTYGVLNAFWFFISMFISTIQSLLLTHPIAIDYGSGGPDFLSFRGASALFPAYFFFIREPEFYTYSAKSLDVLWMLIPTAVFFVLALLLFKKRKVENTGEMVAFGWCKTVFRIMFTLCTAAIISGVCSFPFMIGPWMRGSWMRGSITEPPAPVLIILLVIGGAIGYLISEMLLQKTVKIFSKKKLHIVQAVIPVAVVIVYVILLSTKVIGPKLVPDYDEVARIRISGDDITDRLVFDKHTSPEIVRDIIESNKKLVNDPELIDLSGRYGGDNKSVMFDIEYVNPTTDSSRTLEYVYTDALQDKVLAPIMNTLTKGDHLKEALVEDNNWRPMYARFYELSVEDGKYNWDPTAFNNNGSSIDSLEKIDSYENEENGTESDLGLQLKYSNTNDLFDAILKDAESGRILPFDKPAAIRFHKEGVANKIYGQISVELKHETYEEDGKSSGEDKFLDFCITSESQNTIAYLEQCGALKK